MTLPAQPTQSAIEQLTSQVDPLPPVKGTLKRLLAWIFPANFFIFLMWGAIPGTLLTKQVENLVGANHVVESMIVVSTAGAICAMIAQPIAGQVSDRTRSRFGRRAPWMILGVIVGAVGLIGLAGLGSSVAGITIAWCVVQIAYNFVQGPVSAILPDRVPLNRRGTFSSIFGFGLLAGSTVGGIVGAQFLGMIPVAYLLFAVLVGIAIVLFVIFNPDHDNRNEPKPPLNLSEFLHTFWVNPIKHPDFFWAFLGRLLLYTGYFAVIGYQLLLLQHYLKLNATEVVTMLSTMPLVSLACMVISIWIGGPWSDRIGRRKPFVFVSSALMAIALLVPLFMPTIPGWIIFTILMGLGFGMFQSVDTALMSQVLPSSESFGKDLGVVNIAATLPQVLAPAVAGAIVLVAGYGAMFPIGFAVAILGAFCMFFIRSTR